MGILPSERASERTKACTLFKGIDPRASRILSFPSVPSASALIIYRLSRVRLRRPRGWRRRRTHDESTVLRTRTRPLPHRGRARAPMELAISCNDLKYDRRLTREARPRRPACKRVHTRGHTIDRSYTILRPFPIYIIDNFHPRFFSPRSYRCAHRKKMLLNQLHFFQLKKTIVTQHRYYWTTHIHILFADIIITIDWLQMQLNELFIFAWQPAMSTFNWSNSNSFNSTAFLCTNCHMLSFFMYNIIVILLKIA